MIKKRLGSIRNTLAALALATVGMCGQSTPAMAAPVQLTPQGCMALAEFIVAAADLRDAGVDLDKYLAIQLKNNLEADPLLVALVEHEIRRVFKSGLVPDAASADVLTRCGNARGLMDPGTGV